MPDADPPPTPAQPRAAETPPASLAGRAGRFLRHQARDVRDRVAAALGTRRARSRSRQEVADIIREAGELTVSAQRRVEEAAAHLVARPGAPSRVVVGRAVGTMRGAIDAVADVVGLDALAAADSVPRAAQAAALTAASVGNAAKAAMVGALRAPDGASIDTVASVAASAVQEAAAVGADVPTAAIGAVDGALEAGPHAGLSSAEAGETAATAAVAAAARLSDTAATRVQRAVEGSFRGVRIRADADAHRPEP